MEKTLVKVGSIKAGRFWLTKKAKEEFSNIYEDFSTFSYTVEEKAKWVFNKLKAYEFDESKSKLTVHLPSTCEVSFKDSSIIRYAPRVKAILMRGRLMDNEGMKTKVLVSVKVTNIAVEGHKLEKVSFAAGVKKSRSNDAYDIPHGAIRIKKF